MAEQKFTGQIGRSISETTFRYETVPPKYGENAPNVIYIVLDDLGFSDLGCFGSEIHTPNIDRLAEEGLRFNNFHTTAICSATRASLLTGTNHHRVGVGSLVDFRTGCPNGIGYADKSYANVAEVLHEYGYRTFATGKWHQSHDWMQGDSYDQWPVQRGFERYYGFLTACVDQYHPPLVQDNTYIPVPDKEGYHFSEDITEHAIQYIYTSKMEHREVPFFLYLPYGAMHSPHQPPEGYADRYRGQYDVGWDVIRKRRFERQKELKVIPENAVLTERNELVRSWDELGDTEKKLYAREMENYAGFLTHTDEQIGRLVDFLEQIDQLENTAIVFISDNGASSEGGQSGTVNQMRKSLVYLPEDPSVTKEHAEKSYKRIDAIGTPDSYAHYATGWGNVSNTPFRWYKQWAYEGGTKDPMIIRYPALVKDPGAVREQYVHVTDITPTIYDILNIRKPDHVKGVMQQKMTGTSFKSAIEASDAVTDKHVQYYEMMGNRAIYKDGWKATCNHAFSETFDDDVWELYHVAEDYSEANNVADQYPDKLRELTEEWFVEAGKNNVYPMPDFMALTNNKQDHTSLVAVNEYPAEKETYRHILYPYTFSRTFRFKKNSYTIDIWFQRGEEDNGVLFSYGDRHYGFTIFIKDNALRTVFSDGTYEDIEIVKNKVLPAGKFHVQLRVLHLPENGEKKVTVFLDEKVVGERQFLFDCVWYPKIHFKNDPYNPVSHAYEAPFIYTGEISEITIHTAPSRISVMEELESYFSED